MHHAPGYRFVVESMKCSFKFLNSNTYIFVVVDVAATLLTPIPASVIGERIHPEIVSLKAC